MSSIDKQQNPRFRKSLQLYDQAEQLFPFGVQLLSRSPRLGPFGQAPIFFDRAKDGRFWDVDGNEFVDWSMGIGPVVLGYCYEPVDAAAKAQIDRGVLGSVNNELEIKTAQAICEMVPCAEMVKFCKGGGDADAIAVRLARGYTGKDIVLFCGYHGWGDWYLAANLASGSNLDAHLLPGISTKGVPAALAGTSVPFPYNDLDALSETLERHAGNVACVIMEASRSAQPAEGYLQGVRELTDRHNCLLIYDEVVTGFRLAAGGAQEHFGVTPDLASFGKAIANGYPLAAVAGRREIMASQYDNFISSTYYSDTVSLAAGLATLTEIREKPVIATLADTGKQIKDAIDDLAAKHDLQAHADGHYQIFHASFDYGDRTNKVATLYAQEMIARGVYCTGHFYICYRHTAQDIQQTIAALDETFAVLARAIDEDCLDDLLKAPVRQTLFRRRLV